MTTDHSLRHALVSNSRSHAETDLNRFNNAEHAGTLALAAAGLLLASILLFPRRTKFIAAAMLTVAGAWAARNWLSQNFAAQWAGGITGGCHQAESVDEPLLELNDSLVDFESHQSFPASDPPGSPARRDS